MPVTMSGGKQEDWDQMAKKNLKEWYQARKGSSILRHN